MERQKTHRSIYGQTGAVALGQALWVGAMMGVFALAGWFDKTVLLGGIIGGVLAVANFFFMAVGVSLAADRARQQDVKGAQALLRSSYILRIVLLFIILFACAKSGIADPIALALPLAFVRPTLTVAEFFKRKGA